MDEFLGHLPMAMALVILGLVFKKPLFEILNRLRVKSGETVLEIPSQVEQQTNASRVQVSGDALLSNVPTPSTSTAVTVTPISPGAIPDPARTAVLRNVGVSPLVLQREEVIRRDLINIPVGEQRELLVRNLAILQLHLTAEEVYRIIFGSQLALLEHLNLYGPTPKEKLGDLFYKTAVAQYPAQYASHISEDKWYEYLVSNELITLATDGSSYEITIKGKAFLQWLVDKGILARKMF